MRRGHRAGFALPIMAAEWSVNDAVLARDKRQFYRARIVKVEKRAAKRGASAQWLYKCHYDGWNARHDAWLPSEAIHPAQAGPSSVTESSNAVGRDASGSSSGEEEIDDRTTDTRGRRKRGSRALARTAAGRASPRNRTTQPKRKAATASKRTAPGKRAKTAKNSSVPTKTVRTKPAKVSHSQAQRICVHSLYTTNTAIVLFYLGHGRIWCFG